MEELSDALVERLLAQPGVPRSCDRLKIRQLIAHLYSHVVKATVATMEERMTPRLQATLSRMALVSTDFRTSARELARRDEYIRLSLIHI